MSISALEKVSDSIQSFPSFPDTSLKLIDVLNEQDPSIDEVVEIIRYDPSVTSQILKISNSASFGLVVPVTSINDALMAVGTGRLLQIVMAMQMGGLIEDYGAVFVETYRVTSDIVWQSSVRLAVATTVVGNYVDNANTGALFTSGLLHNVGKSLLGKVFRDQFEEVHLIMSEKGCSFADAENIVLGINHLEAGAMLAKSWGLTESIQNNILYYNSYERTPNRTFDTDTMFLSYLISDFPEDSGDWASHTEILDQYSVSLESLSHLQSTLNTEMNKVVMMLRS